MVENESSGCFSITFKDKEESFIDIYYDGGFRDDVKITPMNKEEARAFAEVLEKMIKRRFKL